jgi:hypothetical protein
VIEGSDAHGLDWCTERLGHERLELELNCTEYDVERTAAAFRRLDFVNAEQHAGWLLEPPDPDETTKFFEGSRKPSSAS